MIKNVLNEKKIMMYLKKSTARENVIVMWDCFECE